MRLASSMLRSRAVAGLLLVLAVFGFVVCVAGGFLLLRADVPRAFPIVLLVLAVVAAVDIVVIVHRKRRGEPG